MTETAHDALPELTFELAQQIGVFPAYILEVSAEQMDAYRSITGDGNPLYDTYMPPGFAGIFGRDAYLQQHRMPPGGVLLAQDIVWHRPARWRDGLELQARLIEATEVDGKRKLVFVTEGRQDGETVVSVQIAAGWPR